MSNTLWNSSNELQIVSSYKKEYRITVVVVQLRTVYNTWLQQAMNSDKVIIPSWFASIF